MNLSAIEKMHHSRFVPVPGGRALRRYLIQSFEFIRRQDHVNRAMVLLQTLYAAGTGDWYDILALREDPGESELRRRYALFAGDLPDCVSNGQVALELFALESRIVSAPIVGRQFFDLSKTRSEETAAQRAIGHQRDSKFAQGGKEVVFRFA